MLTWSVLSFFGLIFAFRTYQTLRTAHLVRQNSSFLLIVILLLTIFMSLMMKNSVALLLLFDLLLLILAPLLVWVESQKTNRELVAHIVWVVDITLVRMSAGSSFREALRQSLDIQPRRLKMLFQDFLSALAFEKEFQCDRLTKKSLKILSDLQEIDRESYRQTERLRSLRKKWRIEQSFRRKSSAALLQVRVQSWVMMGMYVLIVSFMTIQFSWNRVQSSFFCSLPLFMVGFFWIFSLGKRYRWKI